jgi:hypothetical protein
MAVNLESFRYPFETEIANESEGAKTAHRNAFQGILDLNQAVASLKTQLTSATTTTSTTSSSSSTSTTSATETVVTNTATTTIGYVNDQTAVTAYTTQQSDYAKFIILDDASAIAVTLSVASSSPAITTPWYAVFLNFGVGTATLTPISGTISYQGNLAAASMDIAQGSAATVAYDGTDFWAELIPLLGSVVTQIIAGTNVTISPTTGVGAVTINATGGGSGTITGVTAGTGLTGGGTSGTVTLGIATTGVTAGSYTSADITVNAEGQITSASSGGSSYSLGGTLSSSNIAVGSGAGTGPTISVTGLDGNHNVNLTTGTSPVASATLFTLTFTTSRGHTSYPLLYQVGSTGYTSLAQMVIIGTESATQYSVSSGSTALAASTGYSWNISCP